MEKKCEAGRAIMELEAGISSIKNYGICFVAYNLKYLGHSSSNEYNIAGRSTKGSKALKEFCYGHDGLYGQLHLLRVFQVDNGMKYATLEISNNVYAFWEILE